MRKSTLNCLCGNSAVFTNIGMISWGEKIVEIRLVHGDIIVSFGCDVYLNIVQSFLVLFTYFQSRYEVLKEFIVTASSWFRILENRMKGTGYKWLKFSVTCDELSLTECFIFTEHKICSREGKLEWKFVNSLKLIRTVNCSISGTTAIPNFRI